MVVDVSRYQKFNLYATINEIKFIILFLFLGQGSPVFE